MSKDGKPGKWGKDDLRTVEIDYSTPDDPMRLKVSLVNETTETYEGEDAKNVLAWLKENKIVKTPRLP